MGLAKIVVVSVIVVMGVCGVSMGAVYKVGDSVGWTNAGHVDYKGWAASKTFHVGDIIVFEYNNQFHNVIRVTHKNFNSCNTTAAYATLNSGNDSFHIPRNGHYYFICGLPSHCQAGQRVDIRVPTTPSPCPPPPSSGIVPPVSAPGMSPSSGIAPPVSAPGMSPQHSGASFTANKLWWSVVVVVSIFGNAF
ncbi:Mavicyanin like [Actinidia chinensis var. chinensis]|uniref:Mavicyanin like n=1 Tax=Actinidia chinensis var. chinensis TaxID=1590841 RepID=A0A2R6QU63_ACTCC|nr:Mavicyanin like [Actinidia chinensis var. chinensis]